MATTTILLTAATGHIGQKLVPLLLKSNPSYKLVLPTTKSASIVSSTLSINASDSGRVTIAEGSITDPQWVENLIKTHSVAAVFLNLVGQDELFTTMNLLDVIKRSTGVKQFIYLSAYGAFDDPKLLQRWNAAHVVVKVIVEQFLHSFKMDDEGFAWTVVGPTLFFSNDERASLALLNDRTYPEPPGPIGCSRVDVGDIAAVTAKIFEDPRRFHRKKISVGSRKQYTSNDVARLWSEALGTEIKVANHSDKGMDAVEGYLKLRLGVGPAWGRDMRLMYESFRDFGFGMNEEEYQDQVEILGREPASYESYVKELASRGINA